MTKNQFFGFGREKNPNLGKIFNRCRVCRAHAHPLDKLPVRIAVLHSVFPPYQTNEILSLLDEVPIQFEVFTVAVPVDNMPDSYSERLPRAPDPHPAEHHVVLQPRPAAVDGGPSRQRDLYAECHQRDDRGRGEGGATSIIHILSGHLLYHRPESNGALSRWLPSVICFCCLAVRY